jgi:hypothetical protein
LGVRFLAGTKYSSLLYDVQTEFGAEKSLIQVAIRGSFSGIKAAVHEASSGTEVELYVHSPACLQGVVLN